MADPPTLPTTTRIEFLAEGAANVVYRISVPPSTPESGFTEEYGPNTPPPTECPTIPNSQSIIFQSEFSKTCTDFIIRIRALNIKKWRSRLDSSANLPDKLLRLRKDLSTTVPAIIAQEKWEKHILPLFPSANLVTQSLVFVPQSTIKQLNANLVDLEKTTRRKKRHGTFLANDEFGLLITDMTPSSPSEQMIEFKPKWLLQSDTAPKDAIRCRQCAQNASKNSRLSVPEQYPIYCPLDFFSKDSTTVSQLAERLLHIDHKPNPLLQQRLAAWIASNPFTPLLRSCQEKLMHDARFVTCKDSPGMESLCTLMTIRDCTVFLRFSNAGEPLEARIGDLDLKIPAKFEYWSIVQEELIEGGWYQGKEKVRQPNICALSRK